LENRRLQFDDARGGDCSKKHLSASAVNGLDKEKAGDSGLGYVRTNLRGGSPSARWRHELISFTEPLSNEDQTNERARVKERNRTSAAPERKTTADS